MVWYTGIYKSIIGFNFSSWLVTKTSQISLGPQFLSFSHENKTFVFFYILFSTLVNTVWVLSECSNFTFLFFVSYLVVQFVFVCGIFFLITDNFVHSFCWYFSQYRFVCEAITSVYKSGRVKPLPEYSKVWVQLYSTHCTVRYRTHSFTSVQTSLQACKHVWSVLAKPTFRTK